VAYVLWLAGFAAIFAAFVWCSWRLRIATRKSLGKDLEPNLREVFTTLGAEMWTTYFVRQDDPNMESLRRKALLCIPVWCVYGLFGLTFWDAVLGRLS
jgi:hypothetical protein